MSELITKNKVCMMMVCAKISPSICIGKECGQYNQCHNIVHQPKVSVRKIKVDDIK